MIRIILLSIAFFTTTGALLWGLNALPDGAAPAVDQVSRTAPDPLGLQPSLAAATAPVRVEPEPVLAAPAPAANPPALQGVVLPAPKLAAEPEPQPDEMDLVRSMSLGIVRELQKPVSKPAVAAVQTARAQPQPVAAEGRTYTVQPGDSLPGIAFRFYGTTVAYLQILEANADILTDPSELTAGMVLRVPENR